ncbi:HAMP domain-containing protein [candidate division KSB1 bacterium]|nr:HAMP domain-containing protein [candidate division KSB1 bacterium]
MLKWLEKLRAYLRHPLEATNDFFSSLEIKFKLSINIAIIVIAVVLLFSALILPIQHRELEEATRETCTVLIKKLSQIVADPLLDSVLEPRRLPEIPLEVTRTMQMNIKGLEYIVIFDHNGKVVGTSDTQRFKWPMRPERLATLSHNADISMQQDEFYYEFSYPVTATKEKVIVGYACVGFSKKILTQPLVRIQRLILSMAVLVIVVSVWGIYFFARKIVGEIHALADAARKVGDGNLDVYVTPRSKDELGRLAREFNNMVTHLREKLQMQKFLSKLTVEMIQERGGDRVEPYEEGDRRQVTILFSDIRNFSAIAEDSEPELVVKLVNIYFDLQTRIIEANRGVVDKFMGDQIMAIFQGPAMVENAVSAAIDIQRSVKKLNRQRSAAGEITFDLGIGLNQGFAVMGNMGSRNRMDYTVVGDVVNIANRLCSLARSGQIITEYNFARMLNGNYNITRLDAIMVKGRSKPVEISEIVYEHERAAKEATHSPNV